MTEPSPPFVSPRPVLWYWDDFKAGTVREFGRWEVTRDAVLDFARQFDPQPFHLDDDAAAKSLFGRLAASGWHTCAMAMRMTCDEYLLDAASLGSPGLDKLAWPSPVFPGDVMRMRVTVLSTRPLTSRPGVGVVKSRSEMLNQRDELALMWEGAGFFRQRPGTPPAQRA